MPGSQSPLTLQQIRDQMRGLIGVVYADQTFTPEQMDESVNWACERLCTILGMSYVPMTPIFTTHQDPRRPIIPDASVKVVQMVMDNTYTAQHQVPQPWPVTQVLANLMPTFGTAIGAIASDGVDQIFLAMHNGSYSSPNPKNWVIVRASRTGAFDTEVVAGTIGSNDPWPTPPSGDPVFVTPVDGTVGTSKVSDVISMAVSPDGSTVAWLEGSTNILRIAKKVSNVWTTSTVAGSSSTYRTDGTGASAGFSAGLADGSGSLYPAYGKRYSPGWGMCFYDNGNIFLVETPTSTRRTPGPVWTYEASRLLAIDISGGTVTTVATDSLQPLQRTANSAGDDIHGAWVGVTLVPNGTGKMLVLSRQNLGAPAGTPAFFGFDVDPFRAPDGVNWPRYTALESIEMDTPHSPWASVQTMATTGEVPSLPGPDVFPNYLTPLALDRSPKGMIVVRPCSPYSQAREFNKNQDYFTDPSITNPGTTYYPGPIGPANVQYNVNPPDPTIVPTGLGIGDTETMAVGPDNSFSGHMTTIPFGSWNGAGTNPDSSTCAQVPATYLQPGAQSCWIGGELLVVTGTGSTWNNGLWSSWGF